MRSMRLGESDVSVPGISFGAYAIGGWYWGDVDEADALGALDAAFRAGASGVDTAPVYGFGRSEELIGRALAALGSDASEVTVMTKVGLRWDDPRGAFGFGARDAGGRKLTVRRNSRPDSVVLEVDRSLARLGVERIDLVQVHAPDPTTPIADTMGALAELRAAGKVRAIGVSNYDVHQMRQAVYALDDVPLASTQSLYNLIDRSIERDILPLAKDDNIGVLAYSPLDQGLLTGKVGPERTFPKTDGRHKRVTFSQENRRRVAACLAEAVEPVAERLDVTVAQVVLAWTLAQPGITGLLVGARNPAQARTNAAAGELKLEPEELQSIRATFQALRLEPPPPPTFMDKVRGRWHRLRR